MSYDKVKSIKYSKVTGELFLTVACSSLTPTTYERWATKMSLYELFNYALSGSIRILRSCKVWHYRYLIIKETYESHEAYNEDNWRNFKDCPVFKKIVDKVMETKTPRGEYKIVIDGYPVTRLTPNNYKVSITGCYYKKFDYCSGYNQTKYLQENNLKAELIKI